MTTDTKHREGFYRRELLPRMINVMCGAKHGEPHRRHVCAGLSGEVIELGFGSGLNVPFYPATISRVTAVDPSEVGWNLAAKRLKASAVPVRWSGLDGQSLQFPDHSYDSALCTWTLCTIPDASAALSEVRRVLKPGGTLHFVEHGLAPDESVRRRQRRLDPIEQRLFGGCRLTLPIEETLTSAGFTISELNCFYQQGAPKFGGAYSMGVAVSPPA
ncbi:methyltransferase domain-containing protein [Angustibacter sp. McL0619]|uniref:class I SAM-dependent methyltransferase n=1 Tax=Angustibacter sp. McL0619 TaxID=3415676 RepID=UPI003CF80A85